MPSPIASLTLTTLSNPAVLENYLRNFERHGRLDQVQVFMIPDRKTTPEAYTTCRALCARGLNVSCPTIQEQEAFLGRVGMAPHLIPCNSDNRRNVGFLMALETGSDFLISLDDDNYCTDDVDFFGEHAVVFEGPREIDVVSSASGFVNACELLEFDKPVAIYPRGYPYAKRWPEPWTVERRRADIMVNAGLWLADPDVDAMTWLALQPRAVRFTGREIALGEKAWCPVDTQNTAIDGRLIPAYYYVKMGYTVNGVALDRFGDIFSGYFLQACVKRLGGAVRFGSPVADHRRNSHNHMRDAAAEWFGIQVIEEIIPWLTEVRLSGSTCLETYASLAAAIDEEAERFRGALWNDASRGFLHQTAYHMRAWLRACGAILGEGVV